MKKQRKNTKNSTLHKFNCEKCNTEVVIQSVYEPIKECSKCFLKG